jgi:hypothetical protein
VAHVAVEVVEFLPKAEKVIASAIKDQPAVRAAVLTLVEKAGSVIGDVTVATADKGINLAADAKTLADAESFFTWFKTNFIPVIEQLYSEVKPSPRKALVECDLVRLDRGIPVEVQELSPFLVSSIVFGYGFASRATSKLMMPFGAAKVHAGNLAGSLSRDGVFTGLEKWEPELAGVIGPGCSHSASFSLFDRYIRGRDNGASGIRDGAHNGAAGNRLRIDQCCKENENNAETRSYSSRIHGCLPLTALSAE